MEYKLTEKYTQERIDELLRIHHEERLTAENLVEEAKNENNPLHDLFDWDNKLAGDKWRLAQARFIINDIQVIIDNETYPGFEIMTSIITNNPESDTIILKNYSGKAYEPLIEILSEKEKREQLLRKIIIQIDYWKKRYSSFKELQPIFDSIEKVKKKFKVKY